MSHLFVEFLTEELEEQLVLDFEVVVERIATDIRIFSPANIVCKSCANEKGFQTKSPETLSASVAPPGLGT